VLLEEIQANTPIPINIRMKHLLPRDHYRYNQNIEKKKKLVLEHESPVQQGSKESIMLSSSSILKQSLVDDAP
jgi:hypothetical protein